MRLVATMLREDVFPCVATGAAWLVSQLLMPFIEPHYFPFFLCAIALVTGAGGARPAVVAVFLSTLGLADLLPPAHSLTIGSPRDVVGLLAFLVVAAPLIWLIDTLRHARESLEARVTQRTAELAEANRALEAALIERTQLARLEGALLAARTVQHELGNCLALTVGHAELLAYSPDLPPHLRELAEEARRGAEGAGEVLAQLQRLTRLEEHGWGPGLPPTIDLARSARTGSAAEHSDAS